MKSKSKTLDELDPIQLEIQNLKTDPNWIQFLENYQSLLQNLKQKYKFMRESLTQKEIRLEKEKEKLRNLQYKENQMVTLNVRGRKHTTKLNTIVNGAPDSLLAALFSKDFGVPIDENNEVYIDREGKYFHYIMEFLREGYILLPDDREVQIKVAREAQFYGLENLLTLLKIQYRVEPPGEDPSKTNVVVEEDSNLQWMITSQKSELMNVLRDKGIQLNQRIYSLDDGHTRQDFHRLCDGQTNTFVILRTLEGIIFSGFTDKDWGSESAGTSTTESWVWIYNSTIIPNGVTQCATVYIQSLWGPNFSSCEYFGCGYQNGNTVEDIRSVYSRNSNNNYYTSDILEVYTTQSI